MPTVNGYFEGKPLRPVCRASIEEAIREMGRADLLRAAADPRPSAA